MFLIGVLHTDCIITMQKYAGAIFHGIPRLRYFNGHFINASPFTYPIVAKKQKENANYLAGN